MHQKFFFKYINIEVRRHENEGKSEKAILPCYNEHHPVAAAHTLRNPRKSN